MSICSKCGSVISPCDTWASSTVPVCEACLGRDTELRPTPWAYIPPSAPDLTLRDFFAGMAFAGMVAKTNVWQDARGAAREAFALADAMLKAREGGEGR